MINKPEPPPIRLHCDVCGWLKDGKHTNWICRFELVRILIPFIIISPIIIILIIKLLGG